MRIIHSIPLILTTATLILQDLRTVLGLSLNIGDNLFFILFISLIYFLFLDVHINKCEHIFCYWILPNIEFLTLLLIFFTLFAYILFNLDNIIIICFCKIVCSLKEIISLIFFLRLIMNIFFLFLFIILS
jgi:hypothetical protein